MEVFIRDFQSGDEISLVKIYRDALNSLRKSRGGMHPDDYISSMINKPDAKIIHDLLYGSVVVVAVVKQSREIIGMGAITNRLKHRLLGSTYSKNHYVLERYQRGRMGISVGSLLKKATIRKAKDMGFRKIYGYSTPESASFHKKFGSTLYPSKDVSKDGIEFRYFEIVLREGLVNRLPVEPLISELSPLGRLFGYFHSVFSKKRNKLEFYIEIADEADHARIIDILATANMHHIPSEEMPTLDLEKCFVAKVDGKIVGVGGYKMIWLWSPNIEDSESARRFSAGGWMR
jgi:hypothetical protein